MAKKLKRFIVILIILALIWVGIGFVLSYSVEGLSELPKLDVVKKMPIHLWEVIKEWVMGL